MVNIFLDDYRHPRKNMAGNPFYENRQWYVVKDYNQFVRMVTRLTARGETIDAISFDHDLSEEHYQHMEVVPDGTFKEKTGYDAIKWLEEQIFLGNVQVPDHMVCHSMNPSGAERIRQAIRAIYDRVQQDNE